ncbi:hypothetical protein ACTOB_003036 [Actinoplanes oblitus]|uniref:Uncharacterized protein n=1 Tax=Actinoplanes oblitus TaxID=3040509 RepID=A0ABY8WNH3_9ACTN|nr:hypothetical protein [Actinoplanes oblitus]WIM99385.1 hypothetical protein ACTOB_003036 [Actinoplanes oblitus]
MAITNVFTYKDGELIGTEQIEVPDEPVIDSRTAEEIALDEINAVSTTAAKINALVRYIERKAAEGNAE